MFNDLVDVDRALMATELAASRALDDCVVGGICGCGCTEVAAVLNIISSMSWASTLE